MYQHELPHSPAMSLKPNSAHAYTWTTFAFMFSFPLTKKTITQIIHFNVRPQSGTSLLSLALLHRSFPSFYVCWGTWLMVLSASQSTRLPQTHLCFSTVGIQVLTKAILSLLSWTAEKKCIKSLMSWDKNSEVFTQQLPSQAKQMLLGEKVNITNQIRVGNENEN